MSGSGLPGVAPCMDTCRHTVHTGGMTDKPIYNKGVTVEREGRRRFAVWSKGNRWGHFLLRRDAEAFAEDVRYGRAFLSEAGARLIQPKGQAVPDGSV